MNVTGIGTVSTSYGTSVRRSPTESAAASPAAGAADTVQFSEKALALMKAQKTSDAEINQFAEIILRAREQDGYTDPKRFLAGLSGAEMEVLRKSHGLADSIDIQSLDFEGAYNLLLPIDKARDLNDDGLLTTGIGRRITFPPPNAPASVKRAWEEATAGMSDMDRATWELRMFSSQHLQNIHRNDDGSVTVIEPGDSRYRNPFSEAGFSYVDMVLKQIESLEFLHTAGRVEEQRYQEDKAFLNRFDEALKHHGVA